ncbi:hypothetical protein TNCV_3606821 [Trichonephila clavipes]|nr:hypothetical protein TNCV_3606821 [Trichonephila clavipes]
MSSNFSAVQDCLDNEVIQRLVWPARSPGSKPIEMCGDVSMQKLRRWRLVGSLCHLLSLRGISPSSNRTVSCMVLKANDRRASSPHATMHFVDRSDYARQNYGRLLRLTPGIIGAPGGALSIKLIESSKQLLVGLQVDTLEAFSFNLGQKIYENCTKCNLVQATPDHLLFCAGLERRHLFQSSFGVRFSEDSWAHGPGLA